MVLNRILGVYSQGAGQRRLYFRDPLSTLLKRALRGHPAMQPTDHVHTIP